MIRTKKGKTGEGKEKKSKASQSETNLGEIREVVLSPFDSGEEVMRMQDAARSADQRKQMNGGNPKKVEAARR